MKILGICGSQRKESNSTYMVKKVLEGAEKAGAQTELVMLADKNIEFCDGCEECYKKTGKCHFNDDMGELIKKFTETDAIVLGSPTYFSGVSGRMKNFIDRTAPVCIHAREDRPTVGKKCIIIVAADKGLETIKDSMHTLKNFCIRHYMMNCIGEIEHTARDAGDPRTDRELNAKLSLLGTSLVR